MKQYLHLPLSFEHLLSRLFGKSNYHGMTGEYSLSDWKHEIIRIFEYLKKAIHYTASGDAGHQRRMEQLCGRAIESLRAATNSDAVNVQAIEALATMCFEILGGVPDNWDRRAPWHPRYWTLIEHRSLHYVRTPEQVARHLLRCGEDRRGQGGWPSSKTVFNRYRREQARDFVEWFRHSYPELFEREFFGTG